jgi:hypothetical protein
VSARFRSLRHDHVGTSGDRRASLINLLDLANQGAAGLLDEIREFQRVSE